MLNIKYKPSRTIEEGQYYIELACFEPTDIQITQKFGYWCDMAHIRAGILPSIVSSFPSDVLDELYKQLGKQKEKLNVDK